MPAPSSESIGWGQRSFLRTFSSLRVRNYRLFWFGQLISLVGTWIQRIAQAWLVLELTDSAFALGLVNALQFLPLTAFALVGGVFADRFPKRRMLLLTQSVMAIQAIVLASVVALDVVEVWHIYLLAVVLGLATAFDNPARQAFVSEMVGPANLTNAVALNSSLFNMARIAGPAIGGGLIAAFGTAVPFYVNALSFVAVIGGLLLIRLDDLFDVPQPVRGKVLTRLREGVAYAARTPEVAVSLIMLGFLAAFGFNFTVSLPLIARFVMGTDALGFGGLMSAIGVGSLVAALTMAYLSRPTQRMLLLGATAFSLLFALLAFSTSLTLTTVVLIGIGFFSIMFTSTTNSRLQLYAPGELRGRVMSLYIFLNAGMQPIGGLLTGTLAEHFSIRIALGSMAALCGLGIVLGLLYLSRHPSRSSLPRQDLPEPALQRVD